MYVKLSAARTVSINGLSTCMLFIWSFLTCICDVRAGASAAARERNASSVKIRADFLDQHQDVMATYCSDLLALLLVVYGGTVNPQVIQTPVSDTLHQAHVCFKYGMASSSAMLDVST